METKTIIMIAVGLLVVYTISTIYVVSVLKPDEPAEEEKESLIKDSQPRIVKKYTPPSGVILQEKVPDEPEADVEQMKMDVVLGKSNSAPEGTTKEQVIREYLSDCSQYSGQEAISCYDTYYENNDEKYVKDKVMCADNTTCLDEVYLEMAETKQDNYCELIVDEELKAECGLIG